MRVVPPYGAAQAQEMAYLAELQDGWYAISNLEREEQYSNLSGNYRTVRIALVSLFDVVVSWWRGVTVALGFDSTACSVLRGRGFLWGFRLG